jgi:hypothetical protein
MTPAVITAAIDPSAFQGFLAYGPIGLAGLLLVLVVTALSLRWNMNDASARLLRLVLFVGAFCFVAALVAQHFTPPAPGPSEAHVLGLSVFPNGLEGSGLPPARVTINSQEVPQPITKYKIESDVNAVVDVNRAVEFAKKLGTAYIDQKKVTASSASGVNDALKELSGLNAQVQEIAAFITGPVCPGGAHGQPIAGADRLVERTTQVSNKLKNISAELNQSLSVNILLPQ